jgi:hypothetical protein
MSNSKPEQVEVRQFARVFVDSPAEIPAQADAYKSDRGYYYRLGLDSMSATDGSRLVKQAREHFDVEVVGQVVEGGRVTKERRYVDSVAEVPEGYQAQRGPQGGIFYETNPLRDPSEGSGRPQAGAVTEEVGYSGQPVLAVQFDDVESGDRVAFETDDGQRDMGEVVQVDEEEHIVTVESGDGMTDVAAAPLDVDTAKAEGTAGGAGPNAGGDATVTTATEGVHNVVYSEEDEEEDEEDVEAAGDVAVSKEHPDGPLEGDLYCEDHGATFEVSEMEDGCCPWCGEHVSKSLYKQEQGVWTYYYGPQGGEGWINMKTGDIRYQKQRPGEAPEGGDGYGDWLGDGWSEPPENPTDLLVGQQVEVYNPLEDEYEEGEVVDLENGEPQIDAEGLPTSNLPLSDLQDDGGEITAVEEVGDYHPASDMVALTPEAVEGEVEEWALNYEPGDPIYADTSDVNVIDEPAREFEVMGYDRKHGDIDVHPVDEMKEAVSDIDNVRVQAEDVLSEEEYAEIMSGQEAMAENDLEVGDEVYVEDTEYGEIKEGEIVEPIDGQVAVETEDGGTWFPFEQDDARIIDEYEYDPDDFDFAEGIDMDEVQVNDAVWVDGDGPYRVMSTPIPSDDFLPVLDPESGDNEFVDLEHIDAHSGETPPTGLEWWEAAEDPLPTEEEDESEGSDEHVTNLSTVEGFTEPEDFEEGMAVTIDMIDSAPEDRVPAVITDINTSEYADHANNVEVDLQGDEVDGSMKVNMASDSNQIIEVEPEGSDDDPTSNDIFDHPDYDSADFTAVLEDEVDLSEGDTVLIDRGGDWIPAEYDDLGFVELPDGENVHLDDAELVGVHDSVMEGDEGEPDEPEEPEYGGEGESSFDEMEEQQFLEDEGFETGEAVTFNTPAGDLEGEITGAVSMVSSGEPSHLQIETPDGDSVTMHPNSVESASGGVEGEQDVSPEEQQEVSQDAVGEAVDEASVEAEGSPGWQEEWTGGVVDEDFTFEDAEQWGKLSDYHFPSGVSQAFMRVGATDGYDGVSNDGLVFGNFYGGHDELGIEPASVQDPSKENLGRRQMTTYHAADALGGNVPTCSTPDGGDTVYTEGVEGENISSAPGSYLEKVDPEEFYEQAAIQIICGNNDAHSENVLVTPDGTPVFHDIDHSSGPLDSDFTGNKYGYEDAVDRTLGELWYSAQHVVDEDETQAKQRMLDTAKDIASEVASDGEIQDAELADALERAKEVESDMAGNIRENLVKLANGEITWK